MKKFFTLLVMLMGIASQCFAGAEYIWFCPSGTSPKTNTDSFFTTNGASASSNNKHAGLYTDENGKEWKIENAPKMGGTSVTFTATSKFKVILVICVKDEYVKGTTNEQYFGNTANPNLYTLKKDCEQVTTEDATNYIREFTIDNVAPGTYTFKKKTGETGLAYVKVIYKDAAVAKPEINADLSNGTVTMSGADGATIYYTLDGSTPSKENGTVYTVPFTVADGTTVNAIAFNASDEESDMASVTVLYNSGVVALPVISQFNGTFAIKCSTPNAKVEYSLDGTTYNEYTMPVTLFEDKTISVKATRENWTTTTTTQAIQALPAVKYDKQILMGYKTFDGGGTGTLTGVATDVAAGFSFVSESGTFPAGSNNVANMTMADVNASRSSIKLPRKFTMNIPVGLAVNRVVIYSSINMEGTKGWDIVDGIENNSSELVPMTSTNGATPDVRVFNFDQKTGSIDFEYINGQLCAAFAVYAESLKEQPEIAFSAESATIQLDKDGEIAEGELPTFANPHDLAVEFTSSDEEVATVDATGKVTIVGPGTTVISAVFEANDVYDAATVKYTLTVKGYEQYINLVKYNIDVIDGSDKDGVRTDGTTTTGDITVNSVKYTGLKLANGWGNDNLNFIELSCTGGFKKGDIITLKGAVTVDESVEKNLGKRAGAKLHGYVAGEDETDANAWVPATIANTLNTEWTDFANVHSKAVTNKKDVETLTYTLKDDYETLYLSRDGGTAAFVIYLLVQRDKEYVEPVAPAAPTHDAASDEVQGGKEITFTTAENHHHIYVKFEAKADKQQVPAKEEADIHAGFTKLDSDDTTNTVTYTIPDQIGTLTYYAYDPTTGLKSEEATLNVTATTSLSTIDAEAAPVEYFNLQGIRVTEPVGGVFIRKQGTQVTKVVK